MRIVRFIRVMLAILFIYWLGMAGLLASHAYTKGWILADFESVDAKSAIKMMENQLDVLILDVRTKEEFDEKHLFGAINIPVQLLDTKLGSLDNYKKRQILVYCRSGNRSVKASRILEKHAFIPLNVKGGMQQLSRYDVPLAD